jgi:hypothetical protein
MLAGLVGADIFGTENAGGSPVRRLVAYRRF